MTTTLKVKCPDGTVRTVPDQCWEVGQCSVPGSGYSLVVEESRDEGEASASPESVAPRRGRGRPRKHVEEAAE